MFEGTSHKVFLCPLQQTACTQFIWALLVDALCYVIIAYDFLIFVLPTCCASVIYQDVKDSCSSASKTVHVLLAEAQWLLVEKTVSELPTHQCQLLLCSMWKARSAKCCRELIKVPKCRSALASTFL